MGFSRIAAAVALGLLGADVTLGLDSPDEVPSGRGRP
jgi:hypothetical protein